MKKHHILLLLIAFLSLNIAAQTIKHNKQVKLKVVNELTTPSKDSKVLVLDPVNDRIRYVESQNLPSGDLGVLTYVSSYSSIPLESGIYSLENYDDNIGAGLFIPTINIISYETNNSLNFSELSFGQSSRVLVKREQIEQNGTVTKFLDKLYEANGNFIGTIFPQEIEPVLQISYEAYKTYKQNGLSIDNGLDSYIIFLSSNFTETLREGNIRFKITESNYNNGVLELPYNFTENTYVISSDIYVKDKKLSNYKIQLISNTTENKLGILDYSSVLENSIGKEVVVNIKYTTNSTNSRERITPLIKNNKTNVVNLEEGEITHSSGMTDLFLDVYNVERGTVFSGTVFNANSINISEFQDRKSIHKTGKENNVDLFFSAAGLGLNILVQNKYENSYSVIGLGSNDHSVVFSNGEITDKVIRVVSRDETENGNTNTNGTSSGNAAEFNEPTTNQDLIAAGYITTFSSGNNHAQSPATAIVAAKLKVIRDVTGATWDIVREAARQTASNYNNYNIYRGFGQIDVAAAIAIIPTIISNRSLELAQYWKETTPFDGNLKYEDKSEHTPITKKDYEDNKSKVAGGFVVELNEFGAGSLALTDPNNGDQFYINENGNFVLGDSNFFNNAGLIKGNGSTVTIDSGGTQYVKVDDSTGAEVILKSPNGTKYKITVDNNGVLSALQQ